MHAINAGTSETQFWKPSFWVAIMVKFLFYSLNELQGSLSVLC